MVSGVLEPKHGGAHVPGTVRLLDDDQTHVELHPTPSHSINDPLRWPTWKKITVLVMVSFGCSLAELEGTFLSVATEPISKGLDITIAQTQSFTSYPFLGIAVGCVLSAIFARVIGKRPVYLIAAMISLAATSWNSTASTYQSFVGARVVYGLTAGTFQALPLASIGDIFYVHQRGRAMSFFGTMTLGSTQLAPILAGYLTDTYGWRSVFYVLIPFRAILLLTIIFILPETAFNRRSTELEHATKQSSLSDSKPTFEQESIEKGSSEDLRQEQKRSYIQELLPFRRIHSGTSLWAATIQYFIVALYPIVWFTFIPCAFYLAWYLGINITLAEIFGAPPIRFGPTELGYINTFGLPGALVAEANLHAFSDSSCRWLAKRNNNMFEPEFRLLMLLPAVVVALIGYPLYGWYAGEYALQHQISWVAASVFYGMAIFCLAQAQSVALAYLLDAHQEISIEAGMFVVMLRSFFTYGATNFVPMWVEHSGISHSFYEIAGLQTGLILITTTLMYVFGKRVRAYMARHSPVERFRRVLH